MPGGLGTWDAAGGAGLRGTPGHPPAKGSMPPPEQMTSSEVS